MVSFHPNILPPSSKAYGWHGYVRVRWFPFNCDYQTSMVLWHSKMVRGRFSAINSAYVIFSLFLHLMFTGFFMYSLILGYCNGVSSLTFIYHVLVVYRLVSAITICQVSFITSLLLISSGSGMYSLTFGYREDVFPLISVFHLLNSYLSWEGAEQLRYHCTL